jgi:hypothetical protein
MQWVLKATKGESKFENPRQLVKQRREDASSRGGPICGFDLRIGCR